MYSLHGGFPHMFRILRLATTCNKMQGKPKGGRNEMKGKLNSNKWPDFLFGQKRTVKKLHIFQGYVRRSLSGKVVEKLIMHQSALNPTKALKITDSFD